MDGCWLYIVRCGDGSLYTGITRGSLDRRVHEHNEGTYGGYTTRRRPVRLIYSQAFERIEDAIAGERQVKCWSRAKKEALANGDLELLCDLAARRRPHGGRQATL